VTGHESATGAARAEIPLPPQALRFMNESDARFLGIGDEVVGDLRALCALEGDSQVLDVGCGYGRLAHALIRWASFHGSYIGFDVLKRHVDWCTEHLAPARPGRMRFHHVNVENQRYNPEGDVPASELTFPVAEEWAEVVVAVSVFTHLPAVDVSAYLRQISRALRPGRSAYVTFFLLDEELRSKSNTARLDRLLPHKLGQTARYRDSSDPLHMIAYDDRWLEAEAHAAGLVPQVTLPGTWSGRSDGVRYQDTLVLGRPSRRD
jgi:SAM-dependent methyltransferase